MSILFDRQQQPVVLSHTRRRCRRTGALIDNRIERTEDGVPEVIEHISMQSGEGYDAQIRGALTGAVSL